MRHRNCSFLVSCFQFYSTVPKGLEVLLLKPFNTVSVGTTFGCGSVRSISHSGSTDAMAPVSSLDSTFCPAHSCIPSTYLALWSSACQFQLFPSRPGGHISWRHRFWFDSFELRIFLIDTCWRSDGSFRNCCMFSHKPGIGVESANPHRIRMPSVDVCLICP